MDLVYKINNCQTLKQLDDLRQEISIAGMHGEITNFPYLKKVFIQKKKELESKVLREKHLG